MRWYNTNGDEIGPIQSRGASGGLTLPTSQPTLSTSPTGLPSTESGNKKFDIDSLTSILTTGAKVVGTVQQQRQQSGAAAERRARIEACGRKGVGYIFSRRKRNEYQKCVEQAMSSGAQPKSNMPNITPPPEKPKTLLYVGIGIGIIALVGGIFYVIKKKK